MGKKTNGKRIECSKSDKEASARSYKQTKEKIVKIFDKKKIEKEVKCSEILFTLCLSPHFIGCFSEDDLDRLEVCYPCFMIVNIDSSDRKGSHWVALRLDFKSVEIFDPSGFEFFKWKIVPSTLINFLYEHSFGKKLLISPCLQSESSEICGLYCIFYVFYRNFNSFNRLCSLFSSVLSENDDRLYLLLDV